jgi:hypothetical protein
MQSLAVARQHAFYRGEQIDVVDREAAGICRRQDAIRTPLHQRREVVCQERLPPGVARYNTLRPRDMVGIDRIFPIVLTPDGKSYCYTATRNLSDLVAVSGVK